MKLIAANPLFQRRDLSQQGRYGPTERIQCRPDGRPGLWIPTAEVFAGTLVDKGHQAPNFSGWRFNEPGGLLQENRDDEY